MSYGLEVWNSAGVQTLDVTDRMSRIHGSYSGSIAFAATGDAYLRPGTLTVTVPGITNDGSWLVSSVVIYRSNGTIFPFGFIPYINSGNVQLKIYYGFASGDTVTAYFDVMRA